MCLLCVGVLLIWTNISKFQFDQGRGSAWKPAKGDVVFSLHIVIYLFIYFILFYFIFGGASKENIHIDVQSIQFVFFFPHRIAWEK